MKFIQYAHLLASHFRKNIQVETSIKELSRVFQCSERHTKTVVKYLEQAGWIRWEIQLGRGKKPKLTLLLNEEDLLFEEAIHFVKDEQYQKAFDLAQKLTDPLKETFQDWLKENLGIFKSTFSKEEFDILKYPFYETDLMMDPIAIKSRHDGHMVQQIFDRLVEFDPLTKQLVPKIAHHWESMDGKQWTFYLRKGILFHHGKVLTSNDVEATINRLPKESVIRRNLAKIEMVDPSVIVFHLREVNYLFPRYLANMNVSIIPSDIVANDDKALLKHPIGTGPFQLVRNDEELVRLEVFEKYYGYRPWLDRVEMIKTPGKISNEKEIPLYFYKREDSWKKISVQEEGADFLMFNLRKSGPLRDINIRKWICDQLDTQEYLLRDEMVAYSFLTKKSFERREVKQSHTVNEKKKKQIHLHIAAQEIRDGVNHEREARILQQQLKRIGICSTVEIVPVHQLTQCDGLEKFDIAVGGIALSEDQLLSVLTALQTNNIAIYPYLDDEMRKKIDEQIAVIKETRDPVKQWETYFEMEDYLTSNHAIFFLNHRTHTVYESSTSPYVGIQLDSHGRVDYRKVWKRET